MAEMEQNPHRHDIIMLKEEMRQLEKSVSRNNELLYDQNTMLRELLDKISAINVLGQLAGSVFLPKKGRKK